MSSFSSRICTTDFTQSPSSPTNQYSSLLDGSKGEILSSIQRQFGPLRKHICLKSKKSQLGLLTVHNLPPDTYFVPVLYYINVNEVYTTSHKNFTSLLGLVKKSTIVNILSPYRRVTLQRNGVYMYVDKRICTRLKVKQKVKQSPKIQISLC